MASLKNIMNTDDELVDPRSGSRPIDLASRPSLRPNPSASGPSYATSLDQPASSSSHINRADPLGSLTTSSLADPSTSSEANHNMNSRRRSNTSIDSSEPGSSSNAPMRPFPAAAGGGEPHVKLTPITRKISKAKKGVPVHTCNQCPKTFSRAEHLRRHQLSHSPPDLCCHIPGCNKTFYRKDLLDRHLQRHEQDRKSAKDAKPTTTRRNSRTPTQPCTDATREPGLQMPEDFNDPRMGPVPGSSSSSTMVSGPWQPIPGGPSVSQSYTPSSNMTNTTDNYHLGQNDYVLGPTPLPTTSDTFVPNYSEPRNMPELTMLAIPETGTPDLPWRDSSGMVSSASESTFSTPSDNTRHPQFPVRTSSGDWISSVPSYQTTSSDLRSTNMENGGYSVPFTYSSSPPQIYQPVFGDMGLPLPGYPEGDTFGGADQIPTSTVRSMSPSLAVAQSETLVAVPSLPPDRAFSLAGCGSQPPDGGSLLSTEDLMPVPLTAAASEAVPAYLKIYWERVHPNYPIVHKHTFGEASGAEVEHVEVLRYAMAAVATQFIADKDDRMKGAQLHAYAWQKSKVVVGSQNTSAPITPSRDNHQAWKTWVDLETQRRLLAACFLLDVHSSRYHERQHIPITGLDYSSPSTLPIPLTAMTTQLWEAEDHQSWAKLRTRKSPKTLCNTNLGTLAASDMASAPPFDAAVLLAAYSLFLPRRQSPTHVTPVENIGSIRSDNITISNLFPDSAVANTYLALYYTPLHYLLSVSGQSWVFNKKVPEVSSFAEHEKLLRQWRGSDTAVIAVVFAARALKAFLCLGTLSNQGKASNAQRQQGVPWMDISDYWGVYVCALICWAFSDTDKRDRTKVSITQNVATQWIVAVADLEPAEVQRYRQRYEARGVVSLAREVLASDCLGGRNILFADAVGVLKRLERETTGAVFGGV
ncbi:hypothetical protein FALBO_3526 [Fusarium albosuccineum]|uniref:C2H2-type domain-containing protein n=1 Tax=Fusarium albosuccineum TaxID=1237068 RepID=A0A8H4LK05_9HYPO|nr:hypothetical protein FALBO_3526 [Fusarium albosuccineum]